MADKRISVRLPEDVYNKVKQLAERDERTVSQAVRLLIKRWIEEEDPQQ